MAEQHQIAMQVEQQNTSWHWTSAATVYRRHARVHVGARRWHVPDFSVGDVNRVQSIGDHDDAKGCPQGDARAEAHKHERRRYENKLLPITVLPVGTRHLPGRQYFMEFLTA